MHPQNDSSRTSPIENQAPRNRQPGRPGWRGLVLGAGAVLALTGTGVGVAVAGMPTGHGSAAANGTNRGNGASASRPGGHGAAGRNGGGPAGAPKPGTRPAGQRAAGQGAGSQHAVSQHAGSQHAAASGGLRTSCRSVAHVGDSTSVDLISPLMLPDAGQRLAARYRDVGVRHVRIAASGGRSIVEEMPGQRNGYAVASRWRSQGYRGCWVFALGTNDAANVAVGSTVGLTARINRMMAVAHGQPVLWVNTRTELSAGPWSETNERAWDAALTRALARYPNLRIFNWAAVARPGWFLPDGIHYNTAGCAARARAIADALARAFPLHGHGKGRVVL